MFSRNITGPLDAFISLKQDGEKQPGRKLGLCGLYTAALWAFAGCMSALLHWQLNVFCFSVHRKTDSVVCNTSTDEKMQAL